MKACFWEIYTAAAEGVNNMPVTKSRTRLLVSGTMKSAAGKPDRKTQPITAFMNHMVRNAQGMYYLVTGLWPVIHIHSFMLVTGGKTDVWLVKMVGLLSCAIGLSLLLCRNSESRLGSLLGLCSAVSFSVIDIYYAASGIISKIYLPDAAVQLVFIVAHGYRLLRGPKE